MHAQGEINTRQNYKQKSSWKIIGMASRWNQDFSGFSVLENIMDEKNNQWWGWGLDKEISGLFSGYLSLMLGQASHKTK